MEKLKQIRSILKKVDSIIDVLDEFTLNEENRIESLYSPMEQNSTGGIADAIDILWDLHFKIIQELEKNEKEFLNK